MLKNIIVQTIIQAISKSSSEELSQYTNKINNIEYFDLLHLRPVSYLPPPKLRQEPFYFQLIWQLTKLPHVQTRQRQHADLRMHQLIISVLRRNLFQVVQSSHVLSSLNEVDIRVLAYDKVLGAIQKLLFSFGVWRGQICWKKRVNSSIAAFIICMLCIGNR